MSAPQVLAVEPIIGLEVHVQLRTRTKLWCGCPVEFGVEPNTRVCPVCLGLPGALPVLNAAAVELAVRTGLALHCHIADRARWDRKSYYYPDLPKNYQITQYDEPLARDGLFEFPVDGRFVRVRIRRAHLEEDAGKNLHDLPGATAVDLNRAGAPLLEIVAAPDLSSAAAAREFAVQLHRLVRYLGVSDADMQKGQMRFEPNVNLRIRTGVGDARTPIVEIKNLNSFRALHDAIAYEVDRQLLEWRETGVTAAAGNKSNRGWDDDAGCTVPQRAKEEASDYRYFPDPDLVTWCPAPGWREHLAAELPELPLPRTERVICEYKLPPADAPALVDDRATADLLDQAAEAGGNKQLLGRHFLSFWARHAHDADTTIAGLGVPAAHMAELTRLQADGLLNATAAAQVAAQLCAAAAAARREQGKPRAQRAPASIPTPHEPASIPMPRALAEELGVLQCHDAERIAAWVQEAFANNARAVADARGDPKKRAAARGFLVGQVMRLSGGQADPELAGRLVDEQLGN